MQTTDFIVIGSGIAGLNFALKASKFGHVTIITKKEIAESNTNYAQGGIAAVLEKTDSKANHIEDTMKAGAFYNNKEAVEIMVNEGPELVLELAELGVNFQKKESGNIKLTREGGHSNRRIAFSGDTTGAEIEKVLVKKIKNDTNIDVLEHTFVSELINKDNTVIGVTYFDEHTFEAKNIFAKATILASGGAGQIYYPHTTNPEISTGDGIAMGLKVGCSTKDMEFIQFHPTALFKKGLPTFLLSESLRGEGAKLVNSTGKRFMHKYDERLELSPRDIVARAIVSEEENGPVYLDMRDFDMEKFQTHFKKIYETLTNYGMDPKKELIHISPSAHYTIGGIKVDMYGYTGVNRLFAFGEVACTGVHGANRLGSNSLLEGLVFSNRVIKKLPNILKNKVITTSTKNTLSHNCNIAEIRNIRDSLTITMWKYVGIIKNIDDLKFALKKIQNLKENIERYKCLSKIYFETNNMILVSLEVIKSAIKRKKSLGAHFLA